MTIYEFLTQLKIPKRYHSLFKNSQLQQPVFNRTNNTLTLKLSTFEMIDCEVYALVENTLANQFNCHVCLTIDAPEKEMDYQLFQAHLADIIKRHELRDLMLYTNTDITSDLVTFYSANQGDYDYLSDVLELCQQEFNKRGFIGNFELKEGSNEVPTLAPLKISSTLLEKTREEKVFIDPFKNSKKKYDQFTKVKINMLQEEVGGVYFEGELFKIDSRETRNGNLALTLYFVDDNDAIDTTLFVKTMDEVPLKVGDYASVYGDYVFDNYKKQNAFKLKRIEKIAHPIVRKDDAPVKRVELHAHTKASEMDGICEVDQLIKQAHKYGHKAIAITDHSVVHTFPKAQVTANKINKENPDNPIQVIYGVELNVVEDEVTVFKQLDKPFNLDEVTYVIFDLETTGLSSRYDHIIEFGAVKVQQGMIVDRLQTFVKPPVDIPTKITQITDITQEMVSDAPALNEVIDKIRDFIGDSVLVAHNAQFDTRFIQEALRKCGKPLLTNSVIDTLALSWGLIDNRRAYNLGAVSRYYKVVYDQNVAHRADYDAEVLQKVFLAMLSELSNQEIVNSDQLISFSKSIDPIMKSRPYHAIALAKNQEGLKDIYYLVSKSHTDFLMYRGKSSKKEDESLAEARITREEINKHRDNLLIGSACFNSYLMELARTASQQELEDEMKFYDYIELQPLENYNPLLYKESIYHKETLIEMLRNIYDTALKLNIPIVATGDVHYLYKEDKIFRDIYINAMGIGGAKHPLYIYDDKLRKIQEAPNQHLKTTSEMLEGYPYLNEQETKRLVIDSPLELITQIQDVQPVPKELFAPVIEGSDDKLRAIVYENAYSIYGNPLPKLVLNRIEKELDSIIGNGFGVVYYISHLLVKKSLDDGYMVGSRGSVGSSFVATMARITEVNPLVPHYVCPKCHHSEFFENNEVSSGFDLEEKPCPHCDTMMQGDGQDIPFETFLGFEGDKVPDIDLNFSGDYQEKAHNFTKEMFGEDKVLRAGTIGTIAEKTAYGLVSGYFESLDTGYDKHQAYREYLVKGATGVKRSTGQHPGGIVVIPKDKELLDFTPYQYPANNPEASWRTTHYEYHDIESNLLKLDILGHVDPTAMKYLENVSGLDVSKIPLNDPQTMSIFSSTDALMIDQRRQRDKNGAVGLPEFGTGFVRKMLEDTQPKKFSDLVRISGLSHGTDVWLKNAQDLINDGLTLADVIACRDDIMTYLAHQGLPNKTAFTIMESVRKGRGLKDEWIEIMKDHGVADWYINSAQTIKYLFPKAHAVAYCIMGVRVAWFKVHRPLDFYGQFFTLRANAYELETMLGGADVIEKRLNDILSRRNNFSSENKITTKEEQLIPTLEVAYEMCLRGYRFKPIDIMSSKATEFWPDPNDSKALMIPFSAVDALGTNVALNIVNQREQREFLSIEDFKKRTQINQTALAELKKLKALDHLSEQNQMSLFEGLL